MISSFINYEGLIIFLLFPFSPSFFFSFSFLPSFMPLLLASQWDQDAWHQWQSLTPRIPVRTDKIILKSIFLVTVFRNLKKITQYMYTHTSHVFKKTQHLLCSAGEESLIVTPEVKSFHKFL